MCRACKGIARSWVCKLIADDSTTILAIDLADDSDRSAACFFLMDPRQDGATCAPVGSVMGSRCLRRSATMRAVQRLQRLSRPSSRRRLRGNCRARSWTGSLSGYEFALRMGSVQKVRWGRVVPEHRLHPNAHVAVAFRTVELTFNVQLVPIVRYELFSRLTGSRMV